MKVLLGIDTAGVYKPALNLLARLRFEGAEWTLANSVDAMYPIPAYGTAEAAFGLEWLDSMNQLSDETLQAAADLACGHKVVADTVKLGGTAASALMEFAEKEHFDLIAVHSVRKSALGSLFLGSVARGLAIGSHQSVLISKGEVAPAGPIKAVFATDHSDYCERALGKFLELKPKGIASVHVLSAAWMNEYEAFAAQYDLAKLTSTTEEWVEIQLRKKNDAWVEKLRAAGYEATSEIFPGPPDAAIRKAMAAKKADLLVMGAQGHGFIHRLFIGSTSLHQVVSEPWPVLILRPSV